MSASPNRDTSPFEAASYWLPPLCLCILIFMISARPAPEAMPGFRFADKLLHAIVYCSLSILLLRAFLLGGLSIRLRLAALAAFCVASLYGVSDEIHQYFIPSRTASVGDALADILGAAMGTIAMWIILGRVRRFEQSIGS